MKSLFTLLLSASLLTANAQLYVNNTYDVQQMVSDFFNGSAVTVSNISWSGDSAQFGYFDASNSNIGAGMGMAFSTGNVTHLPGPAIDFSSSSFGTGSVSDTDFANLASGYAAYDAAFIEFDMVSQVDTLSFMYVFGSEEYPEFVCSSFNDVFGFMISGPRPSGGYYDKTNIALIPGTNIPVMINSVNSGTGLGGGFPCYGNYSQYYVDNATGTDFTLDAYTTALYAIVQVIPDSVYHVKIGVSDIGDGIFDSGVLLSAASLNGNVFLMSPYFSFTYGGTAVNFNNQTMYARSFTWDFGDGSPLSHDQNPTHLYAHPGHYQVTLTASNFYETESYTREVYIACTPAAISAGGPTTICEGETVTLTAAGNGDFLWSTGETTTSITVSQTGDYSLQVTEDSCGTESATIHVEVIALNPVASFNGTELTATDAAATGWQWLLNGVAIPGATSPTYVPTQSGNYSVQTTNGNCSATSASVAVSISGIKDENSLTTILSNPVRDVLSLNVSRPAEATVYDMIGNKVMQEQLTDGINRLKVSQLAKGVYLLRTENANGRQVNRFVKE